MEIPRVGVDGSRVGDAGIGDQRTEGVDRIRARHWGQHGWEEIGIGGERGRIP